MEQSTGQSRKNDDLLGKVSKMLTGGGIAVAKATGMFVGYSGKALRSVKDKTSDISMPNISGEWAKGLFSGGVMRGWGGEKSQIKVNIVKTRQKIEKLYHEIGKRGARLSRAEDITEHDSVKELINEVKSCESQIQRWESRLQEIDKERAVAKNRKAQAKSAAQGEADDAGVKSKIQNNIDQAMKSAEFENASQKAIFDKVAHDLLDDDVEIRILAAAELGKMGNPAAISILKEALGYNNVYLSSEIINGLITINDPSCLEIFQANVADSNYRIRLGSLRGIYKLASADSVSYLTDALKDEHAEIRKSSATLLGWVGVNDAVPALTQTLKDVDQEVKKAAAMSLSILRDPSSVMPLIRALGESDIEVREKIVHAIERISGKAVEFAIDASGDELKDSIENLKSWWQKSKAEGVDEVLSDDSTTEAETEVEAAAEEQDQSEEAAGETEKEDVKVADTETDTESDDDGDLTEEKLQRMLKKDLVQKCEEMGIEFSSDDTKAVLVEKILEQCGN